MAKKTSKPGKPKPAAKAKPVAKKKAPVAKPQKATPVKAPQKPAVKVEKKVEKAKTPAAAPVKPAAKPAPAVISKAKPEPVAEVRPRRPVMAENATIVPPDYDPKKDKGEFMNPVMLEYFRQKLLRWRSELLRESSETIHNILQSTELQKPDLADRASAETDHALELRTRDRERKLVGKINEALMRIEDGEYGYCEETGEPITVARLDARPNATLSIEAQERHERMERTQREE